MKLSEKSLPAMKLGFSLQFLNWEIHSELFDEKRDEIIELLDELKVSIDFPDNLEDYRNNPNIIGKIKSQLAEHRRYLGADLSLLPMFYYGYLPFELIVHAAMDTKGYENRLVLFHGLLLELGISGEFENIKYIIDKEVDWLKDEFNKSNENSIKPENVYSSTLRLGSLISNAWDLSTKTENPVVFGSLPLYSVFISYSTSDQEFCNKLYDRLVGKNIRTWFAPHAMKAGEKLHKQIKLGIEKSDKLLIVLSPNSMQSNWVNTELYTARQREIKEKKQIIFPIAITSFENIRNWESFDADSGRDLAREIREYYIPDFSEWQNEDKFKMSFEKLLNSLIKENEN